MHLAIHNQLIAFQVDACKERIFCEGVICDQVFFGIKNLGDAVVLLMVAAEQKENLGLKSISCSVCVKIGEEWILLKYFQQDFRFECRLQEACKRGFSPADHSFDGDVHEIMLPK